MNKRLNTASNNKVGLEKQLRRESQTWKGNHVVAIAPAAATTAAEAAALASVFVVATVAAATTGAAGAAGAGAPLTPAKWS